MINEVQLDAAMKAWELAVPMSPDVCICGEQLATVVGTQDRFGLPLRTSKCVCCGTLRSSHVIPRKNLQLFYREAYPIMHPGLNTDRHERELRQAAYLARYTRLGQAIRSGEVGRLLEIGGRACQWLDAGEIVHLDVADGPMVAHGQWDAVVALHVLEHCTDPICELKAWASYLRPGGMMLVVVPNALEVSNHRCVASMGMRGWWHLAHAWNWQPANIRIPFGRAGLYIASLLTDDPGTLATVGSIVVEARLANA